MQFSVERNKRKAALKAAATALLSGFFCLLVYGCALGDKQKRPFQFKNLAKNDMAMVLDAESDRPDSGASEPPHIYSNAMILDMVK